MSELYRLVYASKNLLQGSDAEIAAGVRQILAASQRNNAGADVTGALMFNAGAFAQVLEGPRKAVEETFERIQCDARHGDVTVLQCGPAQGRSFTNWSMAFAGQSATGHARFSGLAAESGFDLSRLDGDAVFAMLHDLVLEEEGMLPTDAAVETIEPAAFETAEDLDIRQLRAELEALLPNAVSPRGPAPTGDHREGAEADRAPKASTRVEGGNPSTGSVDAALQVLKAALTSERERTNDLRGAIDTLQISLALCEDRLEAMREERDLWAGRAGLLATALSQDADAVRGAAPRPPAMDRARRGTGRLDGRIAGRAA